MTRQQRSITYLSQTKYKTENDGQTELTPEEKDMIQETDENFNSNSVL